MALDPAIKRRRKKIAVMDEIRLSSLKGWRKKGVVLLEVRVLGAMWELLRINEKSRGTLRTSASARRPQLSILHLITTSLILLLFPPLSSVTLRELRARYGEKQREKYKGDKKKKKKSTVILLWIVFPWNTFVDSLLACLCTILKSLHETEAIENVILICSY